MDDLFSRRMSVVMKNGSLGSKLVEDSNIIENKLFGTDANFRTGKLYDWDMNELDVVDFKFEKVKTYSAEKLSVEYMVHFRPNYHPELKFKDKYYKNDGKERLGFYIDVYDSSKDIVEKWLIVGKDDRVAFDRYNALKCDWCFEWVGDGKYYNSLGCIRSAQDGSVNNLNSDDLGGTSVNDELSIFLPSNYDSTTIKLGTRFIISDNITNPWVYEVIRIKDTSPLGTTKVYLKQALFNPHTDVCGIVNDIVENEYCFELPLKDLPSEYGGEYHMICDCIKSKGLPSVSIDDEIEWKLDCKDKFIYVNGQTVVVKALCSDYTTSTCKWHVLVDNVEYAIGDLEEYFNITIEDNVFTIKAINKNMAKYIVKIAIYDKKQTYYDSVEMEVRL